MAGYHCSIMASRTDLRVRAHAVHVADHMEVITVIHPHYRVLVVAVQLAGEPPLPPVAAVVVGEV